MVREELPVLQENEDLRVILEPLAHLDQWDLGVQVEVMVCPVQRAK